MVTNREKQSSFRCSKDIEEPHLQISMDILHNTNFCQSILCLVVFLHYHSAVWNYITKYDEKTRVYCCQVDEQWFNLSADLLRKALDITLCLTGKRHLVVDNPRHPVLQMLWGTVLKDVDHADCETDEVFECRLQNKLITQAIQQSLLLSKYLEMVATEYEDKHHSDSASKQLNLQHKGIHCISKFPSIYIQLFWNTLTHDAKTGRSLLHDNIVPKPDLALELGKSISLTEAEEEAVAREVHATHARIVSGPDPEPMQEDQTGSNSRKLHVSLAGPNPEYMDDEFLVTAYPKVHENLKLITDERVIKENPESHFGFMSSMKNLDDTYNFGDQFLYDKPTEDDQEKSKVIEESNSTIPDPSHQTVTSTPPVIAPFTDVSSIKLSSLLRVARLEQEMSEVKKTDHSADKYSVLPGPESIKNQKSEKSLKEIIIIKREQGEEKQDSTYSIRSTDKVAFEEFDLKSALFKHMNKNKTANRNHANYHLYHALMEALIAYEDALDKEVTVKVKDHKRKHDSDDDEDDDDDEGPSAGSNQGRSAKRRRPEFTASGSAQPPPENDDQSSKKPWKSDAYASKQHPDH
ncbi:hypothetical protein Tco_0122453 [Tanacetum coccineum]